MTGPDYANLERHVPEETPRARESLPWRRDTIMAALAIVVLIAFVAWKVLGG